MQEFVLEGILQVLERIDSNLERLTCDTREQLGECLSELAVIRGAVDEIRMDVSGFEQNGSRVPGQLALLVESLSDLRTEISCVETAVQSVETAVTCLDISK